MAAVKKRTLWQWVAFGSELAFIPGASLAVGYAIGYHVDRWLKTAPTFALIFTLLGIAGGLLQVYRMLVGYERNGNDSGE